MGYIFIEPDNFFNLLMLLDLFLSFKVHERFFYFVGTYKKCIAKNSNG